MSPSPRYKRTYVHFIDRLCWNLLLAPWLQRGGPKIEQQIHCISIVGVTTAEKIPRRKYKIHRLRNIFAWNVRKIGIEILQRNIIMSIINSSHTCDPSLCCLSFEIKYVQMHERCRVQIISLALWNAERIEKVLIKHQVLFFFFFDL